VRQALALRRSWPQLFGSTAAYEPIAAVGSRARHVVAFLKGAAALIVVPRLVLGLSGNWADTAIPLPSGSWRNVMTGDQGFSGEVRMMDLLRRFPVALLVRGQGR
jgi:(1->4)-alpha-D-glucan 1-alpha-D-glucosylmutase